MSKTLNMNLDQCLPEIKVRFQPRTKEKPTTDIDTEPNKDGYFQNQTWK